MKILTLVLMFILTVEAHAKPDSEMLKKAVESQKSCKNFVDYDDDSVYFGYGEYRNSFDDVRLPIPSKLNVVSIANPQINRTLTTLDSSLQTLTVDNSLWVLTYSALEEWDKSTWQRVATYPTQNVASSLQLEQHARGFARYKNQLVIAHGRLGLTLFDLNQKEVVTNIRLVQNNPNGESTATGVVVQGRYAIVVMDNFTVVKPPESSAFRGFVIVDLETQKVAAELDGMDPSASALVSDGKNVLVSFDGMPIWKYNIVKLFSTKLPAADKHIWKFPVDGHPIGKPSLDEKYYYTCYSKMPEPGEGPYFKKIPMALEREPLGL